MSGGPLLSLDRASVRFGDVLALREVSLTIRSGEVVTLVGANGSGKTTLLRLLHGLVAHQGQRRASRVDESGRPLVQRMVHQKPFVLRLSVLNNLRVALWLGGVPRRDRERRADEALRRVGLTELRGRPARALSGGQQQRLALARAWAVRPDILFLDEPTASLDPTAKKEVELLLQGFAADGMTLVMSTHNLGQAKRLARRVVFLDGGRILADETAAEFFRIGPRRPDGEQAAGPARLEAFLKGELGWTVD